MKTLEERVAELESAFAEVAKSKGIQGPPGREGRPGNIDSAVVNATTAAKEATRNELEATLATAHAIVTNGIARIEAENKNAEERYADFKVFVNDILTSTIVTVLRDYGLLTERNEPTHWVKS